MRGYGGMGNACGGGAHENLGLGEMLVHRSLSPCSTSFLTSGSGEGQAIVAVYRALIPLAHVKGSSGRKKHRLYGKQILCNKLFCLVHLCIL